MTTSGRALSIALMMRAGRGDPLRRVLDRDGVGRRQLRDPPRVDDDAQDVDRFLEIGVAQIERADDLVFVLAALGRRVGHDRHACAGPLTFQKLRVA